MKKFYFLLNANDYTCRWTRNFDEERGDILYIRKNRFKKWEAELVFVKIYKKSERNEEEENETYEGEIKNMSIMKSCFQKLFRRMKIEDCLKALKTMIILNLKCTLKRLLIIFMEDTIYDELMNALVWLSICVNFLVIKLL